MQQSENSEDEGSLEQQNASLRNEVRRLRAERERQKAQAKVLSANLLSVFEQVTKPREDATEQESGCCSSSSSKKKTRAAIDFEWAQSQPEYLIEVCRLRQHFDGAEVTEKELEIFAFVNLMEAKEQKSKAPIKM